MKIHHLIAPVFLAIPFFAYTHIEPPKTQAERQNTLEGYNRHMKAQALYSKTMQKGPTGQAFVMAEYTYDSLGREKTIILHNKETGNKTWVTQTYDQHSNLVLDADQNEDGKIAEMNILEYNDHNFTRRVVSYDSSLRISGILEYTYLTDTVVATKYKADFTHQYTIHYVYKNERNIQAFQHDAHGKLMIRTVNHFDQKGNRTKKEVFNAENQLDFYYSYTYTPSGDFAVIEKLNPQNELMRKDVYTYNEKGLPEQITLLDGEGNLVLQRTFLYTYYTNLD